MDSNQWEEWVEGKGCAMLDGMAEDRPGGLPVVPSSQMHQTTNAPDDKWTGGAS